MDIPFNITRWQPTQPMRPGEHVPNLRRLEPLSHELAIQTKALRRHPYDPELWLLRSATLHQLQYPELAFGDAHKATLLCAQLLERLEDERVDGRWRLGCGRGFWMLETGCGDEGFEEKVEMLKERARKAEEKCLSGAKEEGSGKFCPRPYPWLEERWGSRSDELVAQMNAEFTASAQSMLNKKTTFCEVRQHAFGGAGEETRDVLGVYATRPVAKGTAVLVDRTRIWGCNGPGTAGDLNHYGCSGPIHPNLPSEDARLDLRWVRDEAGKDASTSLLFCRIALAVVEDGYGCPLEHSLVARLTPSYRTDGPAQTFYRNEDFELAFRALRQFGIDIFADEMWETWVLFTLFARIENNSCGCVISEALMPLFSLFNHSCEPNVGWSRPGHYSLPASIRANGVGDAADTHNDAEQDDDRWHSELTPERDVDHSTVVVTTLRDIEGGEQLFVEYDSFEHDKSVAERRERLRKWLVGDCQCVRCVREEREEQERMERMEGVTQAVSAKGEKSRRDSLVREGEKEIEGQEKGWDDRDVAVLAEDEKVW